MKKNLLWVGLGSTLMSVGLMSGLQAQEVKQLEEVEISASKIGQKQSQTGKVVSIISQEVLSRSVGKSLMQLLNEQAGLQVAGANSNAGLNKSLFIRGAGSSYALILIDGIPQNDPAGVGGAIDLRMLPIEHIERIEILKGGQSTIYGADAVGGVINIITKKQAEPGNHISGLVAVGSYKSRKGSLGLSSKVQDFSYNLVYSHEQAQGINESDSPNGDLDGLKTNALNANFALALTPQFTVQPFVRYFQGRYDIDEGAFADGLPQNHTNLKHIGAGMHSEYALNNGKITLNFSHETNSNQTQNSYNLVPNSSNHKGRLNLIDLYYNQKLGEKVDLLVGLDNRDLKLFPQGSTSINSNLFSAYSSLFLHDLSIFNLEIGGRYNHHNQFGKHFTYSVTPSIMLLEHLKFFGTLSTAFKTPSLSNLLGVGGNINLKPERSTNYEAGFNLSLFENQFTFRASAFKRDLKEAIVYAYPQGYINQLSQSVKGFEIEPVLQLNTLKLSAFYAYLEGNEFNYINNQVDPYLFRRPKHSFGANAGLQATEQLYLSAHYQYAGMRHEGDFNSYSVINLPKYQLVNLYGEYAFLNKQLVLFGDFKNILNEKYTEVYGYNTLGFNFNAGIRFNIR